MSNSVSDDGSVRFQSAFTLTLPRWSTRKVLDQPLGPLIDLVVERCSEAVFPALKNDVIFMESFRLSAEENIQALRDVLVGTMQIDEVPLENRLRFTTVEAQARVTQAAMQRSFRLSFFLQWQTWSQLIAATALSGKVSASEVGRAQQSVAAIVMAYADTVVSQLSQSFAGSEEALSRSRHHVRQNLVKGLLDGEEGTLSPADLVTLDYAIDGWHLAVLLPTVATGAVGSLLSALRSSVHHESSLAYSVRLESTVLWLGSPSKWTDDRIGRVSDTIVGAGLSAFVSDSASGLDGFRSAFHQSIQVENTCVAVPSAVSVVKYTDVQLEILLLQNPKLAQEFVARELGPLSENTVEAAKLRATIDASFRFGSHVGAAEYLQLHEHSVRNRLQRAQDLLGPLQERRTEIQVALRMWRLLDRP